MKKATRKIYLSIIFVTLSLLTMVATTFAWVGIVSNASFERFTINLETDNEKSDYGIMLSLTGKSDDFHDSIDTTELQKRILLNMGVEESRLNSDSNVKTIFNSIKLSQCTTTKDWDDNGTGDCHYLDPFTDVKGGKPYATLSGKKTNYTGYFEFDIWVTIYKIGEESQGSEKKLDIYLRAGENGGMFSGNVGDAYIANEVKMPDSSNPLSTQYLNAVNNFEPGKTIKGSISINSANAVRLSVQKANSVEYGNYADSKNNLYTGLNIYKYGSDLPSYDSRNNLYDFGGILPTDFNFARLHYNTTHQETEALGEINEMYLPSKRGDITYEDDGEKNHIVTTSDNVTTSDMIKMHFVFWFEGWDSDCFEAINDLPVGINLNFSTKNPNEA